MSKIYGSPLWLSGGGGMNNTLPPLLDNFKATRNEGNITLSASKMEESRAKDLAGAVWVYGEHIPQNVNDGTKIQLTRDECIISQETKSSLYSNAVDKLLESLPSGSRIKLGKLKDTPLQWKLSRDTITNELRLVLERTSVTLLGKKSYDAAEPSNPVTERRVSGNNRYLYSNISQWLNSDKDANEWYTPSHTYDAPPTYQNEAGFLNQWSELEKSVLNTNDWKTINATIDGGGEDIVRAKVAVLSIGEIGGDGVKDGNRLDIFNSDSDRTVGSDCWTRSAVASNPSAAWYVNPKGAMGYTDIRCSGSYSVRTVCAPNKYTMVSDTVDSDGCYNITRISGKVEKQVSWEKTKNFHVRQFTYNSKKQYQTMLEGAVASAIYSEFPEEPTDYLNCAEIPNTTEYEIPEDGWFRIDAIAKSGDGRRELRFTTGTPIYEAAWYSSGGGGTGGYSRSEVALFKGDKLSIQITDSDINITGNSILINVTSGKDGNPASQDKIGTGGAAGTASGGNKINQNGLKGSDGNRVFQPGIGGKVDGGKGANQGEIQINNQKSYAIFGGNSASATKFTSSGMTEVAETSGNIAKVFISRGNTNIPSPSKASTLSLIPKNNSVEATWENSGDPVQTGTMLVYNTSHTPKSPSDGVAVDIPLTQPVTLALNSDSEELQEDSKKQSYTITGVPNDKPVFVALFPYDKDRKYGLAKQEVEIPREHSWYDKQQELEA